MSQNPQVKSVLLYARCKYYARALYANLVCQRVNHFRCCPLITSFPYLFASSVKRPGASFNSRVPGDKRSEVMIGVTATQVEEAQVAAFNHRPPQLINGHAAAKISPRPPLIYDRGAPVSLGRTMGRRMGLASGCFHSKFRSCGCKLGMMVAAGIY